MKQVKLVVVLALEKLISGENKKHVFLAWYTEDDNIQNVINDCVRNNFSRINSETLNYVDYKISSEDYSIVTHYLVDNPEGITIVKSNSSYEAYKSEAQKSFIKEFSKDISQYLSQFVPGMQFYDSTIPTHISISYSSEYDDNNYYTDIDDVSFYDYNSSSYSYYESDCQFIDEYDDVSSINRAVREFIRENYNISEIELYISTNNVNIDLQPPSEEDLKFVSDICARYNNNTSAYTEPAYDYDKNLNKYVFISEEKEQ